jgi:branched-chain amino acid transport system ATP-binding protein
MLELENVESGYGDHRVLHGVSLTVQPGRISALLGRNGTGKTTCLHTIMGFVRTSGGRIDFDGASLRDRPSHDIARQGLGLVPQGKRLFASLSVRENLTVAARPGAWTLERVFALFPVLAKRASVGATLLSGGEQQMLIIGRALMTNPKILLMDESTEGLAPVIVNELAAIVRRLAHDEGLGILLVEQNLGMALTVADDVCALGMGTVAWRGSAAQFAADTGAQHELLGVSG